MTVPNTILMHRFLLLLLLLFCDFFYKCIVSMGFLQWEIRVAFPGKSQLQQSRATQLRVHAERFGDSIIDRTLTWTTGSFTCPQM